MASVNMVMDCANCAERLADFLLDELPESEAVLVQEHLILCPRCMRTYKELKGTGMALEAVPSMRPVEGSPEFEEAVRAQAAVELANILNRLPPDKRLRIEARRAARLSRVAPSPAPRHKLVSLPLVAAFAAGVAALALILAYPSGNAPEVERTPIGRLSVAAGTVEQFYQRANEPHTQVKEGKVILPGDAFSTTEKGSARFDIEAGGALFLGPSSHVTFRVQPPGSSNFVVVLESGELGLLSPRLHPAGSSDGEAPGSGGEDAVAPQWEVRSEVGTVLVGPGAHVYLKVAGAGGKFSGELTVLPGSVEVLSRSGRSLGSVTSYHRAVLTGAETEFRSEPQEKARMPVWRLDLVSDAELATILGARVKVLGRRAGVVEAEVLYGSRDLRSFQHDWLPEATGIGTDKPADSKRELGAGQPPGAAGGVSLPPGTRRRHVVPFVPPLVFELALARESQGGASFAFGALGTPEGGVAVDVARDAVLQVRDQCRTARSAALPVRAAGGKLERLRLEIVDGAAAGAPKPGLTAQLIAPTGKSKPLPLGEKAPRPIQGKLWLQSLGDTVGFDEVRITGCVPAEWLRERLSR